MSTKMWYEKQLRMLQTVLREPDIVDYDAASVIQYMEEVKANCIIINAGGISDYFENNLEPNNPNPFLKKQNILADLISIAHENNIKVITRVDFRGAERDIYQRYPDWFGRNADGSPMLRAAGLCGPCFNSEYMNGHARRYIQNIFDKFDIDGIWENALSSNEGVCYCKSCKELYLEETGSEIPLEKDITLPIFDNYWKWKAVCADRHLKLMRETVKSFGDDKAYAAEIFGIFHVHYSKHCGIDLYSGRNYFDFLISPTFLNDIDPISYSATITKFLKALDSSRQSVILYGNNGNRARYVRDHYTETRISLWQAIGTGASFWNCMFVGQHPGAGFDRRNELIEKDAYHFLANNEILLGNQLPIADVAIFYSKPSREKFGDDDEKVDEFGVYIKGAERILNENHIQYTFLPDIDISAEKLKGFKLLILPNVACISEEHITLIREYVAEGGGLVASYETSLYDEMGNQRTDFGMKDMLGVSYTGLKAETQRDNYQLIRRNHEVLEGIDNTSMLINEGGYTLLCKVENKDYEDICTYIPQIPNQPPEKSWIKNMETDYPTIIAGSFGKGRVVYFSNQIDRLCYTHTHEDYPTIYKNALNWAAAGEFILETNAPASVTIYLTQNKDNNKQYILSLINLTSGSSYKPINTLLPVYDISVKLKLKETPIKEFKILKQDGKIDLESSVGNGNASLIHIKLEKLIEFTSVYLELN